MKIPHTKSPLENPPPKLPPTKSPREIANDKIPSTTPPTSTDTMHQTKIHGPTKPLDKFPWQIPQYKSQQNPHLQCPPTKSPKQNLSFKNYIEKIPRQFPDLENLPDNNPRKD